MTKLPNQIFKDQSAPATALLAAYINMYGLNHFDDEPEAVRANIKDDLNINLTDLQCNKLQAAITVLTTNQYEVNMQAFEGKNDVSRLPGIWIWNLGSLYIAPIGVV